MADETPLEPRYVVWRCDHCRNGIEFDAVQLVGRLSCRVPCPHCGKETDLQEPPPPPRLVPDAGWVLPAANEFPPKVVLLEPPSKSAGPPPQPQSAPLEPKPITVNLPPDPPPPPPTGGKVDVRWLTDLGVIYFRQHQFAEAFLCFSRAAQRGFATAEFCLAVCYLNGHGTAQDDAAALPWLQRAAARGDANAEFALGMAYRLGRGVTRDETLAVEWIQKAASHGHAEAAQQMGEKVSKPEEPKSSDDKPSANIIPPISPAPGSESKPRQDLQRLILGLFKKK